MRPVQYFDKAYLERCRRMSPEQILEFLESFRRMGEKPENAKLISLKVPETLLTTFRLRCELEGVKYQTWIKMLMQQWLSGSHVRSGKDAG